VPAFQPNPGQRLTVRLRRRATARSGVVEARSAWYVIVIKISRCLQRWSPEPLLLTVAGLCQRAPGRRGQGARSGAANPLRPAGRCVLPCGGDGEEEGRTPNLRARVPERSDPGSCSCSPAASCLSGVPGNDSGGRLGADRQRDPFIGAETHVLPWR
jgi:hypothetical protein